MDANKTLLFNNNNICNNNTNVNDISPMFDELVNVLYTDSLNNLIDTKCKTTDDKRVFFMFLIMYFHSYLSIPLEMKPHYDIKTELKRFLSELIRNPDKRKNCLDIYTTFEKTLNINFL
jgi:hypothetical protein